MTPLSPREQEILHLIANEKTMKDIAVLLYISIETVKTHRKKLFEKLRARNTAGLVRRAFEFGILKVSLTA